MRVSKIAILIFTSTSSEWKFQLFTPLLTHGVVHASEFNLSGGWTCFQLHSSDRKWYWMPFHMRRGHLNIFFCKAPVLVICSFFHCNTFLILIYKHSLCICKSMRYMYCKHYLQAFILAFYSLLVVSFNKFKFLILINPIF